jgi:beta-glucosidase-like glycosyl hydrolase
MSEPGRGDSGSPFRAATIDDHLRRLLRLADRVGALGKPRDYPDDLPAPDSPSRRSQLTRLAAEGITVLTNREATLPLAAKTTVALIGRHAVAVLGHGGRSLVAAERHRSTPRGARLGRHPRHCRTGLAPPHRAFKWSPGQPFEGTMR